MAPKVLNDEQIDNEMAKNDELTARQIQALLLKKWPQLVVSLTTIKKTKKQLGWVVGRPKYCQLVRVANKQKRVDWCRDRLAEHETFDNAIFTDECTVQLDNHSRLCFRKRGHLRKFKPKPKHPVKVHVWAGISRRGATSIIIFKGILTATRYAQILETGLKPFINKFFPDKNYCFQQDNDPKHTSAYAKEYYEKNQINWWKTPAESPDLTPIENVWASLKYYYLRYNYKPTSLATLKAGIVEFWKSMTPVVCSKNISHLYKVMPRVVELDGCASGF